MTLKIKINKQVLLDLLQQGKLKELKPKTEAGHCEIEIEDFFSEEFKQSDKIHFFISDFQEAITVWTESLEEIKRLMKNLNKLLSDNNQN